MARYRLENDAIRIEIESHGAELKSLVKKETGTEYMWCADGILGQNFTGSVPVCRKCKW